MIARQLANGEAAKFKALWLDGLREFPEAFLLTEQEAQATPVSQIETAINAGVHWGIWNGEELFAIASMRSGGVARLAHTADLGPFYVSREHQGKGVAKLLLEAIIDHAKGQGLLQIELCVDAKNTQAKALYAKAGFAVFGTRTRSVIVDGVARDDLLMMCKLD